MCLNCLSDQHRVSKCKSKNSCSVCGFRHNTLLHRQKGESANAPLIYSASPLQGQELNPNAEEFHSSQENTAASLSCTSRNKTVILPTAVVWVLNHSTGSCIQARAVLDSGSMSNIVTQDFANRLGAPQNRVNFPISILDGNNTIVKSRTLIFNQPESAIKPAICGNQKETISCSKSLIPSRHLIQKKGVLSVFARLYDPLGANRAPSSAKKNFLKKFWLRKLLGKILIPDAIAPEWLNFLSSQKPRELKISRYIHRFFCGSCFWILRCLGAAYGAVVYSRGKEDGTTTTVLGKSRVAPIKHSIPPP
ncbi:DUF1758 domain-containing protein [Trichonephila inaurata madagascariensis]|uniref:DUF1758 domain-containing protein n=1 Tax=Trichonephila inaurata madagascariensis TaxID=2747483 RepID=A0A8X6Y678_9ARAC|nr:DUF1758 domain-containing protein [Trichonephila inaurata madagascariensis]